MTSESGTPEGGRPWTLLLGPGERLDEAFPLFQALLSDPTADDPFGGTSYLEQMEDLGALICEFPESGRLLLDTDAIPAEDVGLVRRFCTDHPNWELHLLGDDPGRSAARALRQLHGARWWPAPLDVWGLRTLVQAGREPTPAKPQAAPCEHDLGERLPSSEPRAPGAALDHATEASHASELSAPSTAAAVDEDSREASELLAQVEAILGGAPVQASISKPTPSIPEASEEEIDRLPESAPPSKSGTAPAPPAPYFKHQVADLADLVQRVELTLDRLLREAELAPSAEVSRRAEELTGEVARLKQFARTLSFLAAPPAPGTQRFELAPMIEELLAARRSEPGSPRYLLRTSDLLAVRSDKSLLAQVFDALLYLCHHLAPEQGSIRVDGRLEQDPTGVADRVRVSIRFEAPDHPDLAPEAVLTPYGLRRILPELGPNALAAAAGILRGQGGGLELLAEAGGGFEWVLRLPHAG